MSAAQRISASLTLASASLAALVAASPARAQEVGRAAAVNPAAASAAPSKPSRVLELGANVVFRERIQTTNGGNVQLLFVDKTTLNIGPNSDVVIDEFVYDPKTNSGRMALSMAKGVLRFVGGNVSHTGGATIKTPATTLGIRGGVATVRHDAQQGTRAINNFGLLSVSNAAGTEVIRRPGFGVTVTGAGVPPTPPQKVSAAEISAANAQLTSARGQSGGAKQRPTEATVAQAGVGQENSRVDSSTQSVQSQTAAARPASTSAVVAQTQGLQDLTQEATVQAQAEVVATNLETARAQEAARLAEEEARRRTEEEARRRAEEEARRREAETRARSRTARAFVLTTAPDPALNSSIPYAAGIAVASGGVSVSPIYGYRNAAPDPESGKPTPARVLQTAFGVNGAGASQTSNIMVMTGIFDQNAAGETIFAGGARATSRRAANISMGRAFTSVTSTPGSVALDDNRIPTGATVTQDSISTDLATRTPELGFARPGGNGAGASYRFQQTFSQGGVPAGLGERRPEAFLYGSAGGMVRTHDVAPDRDLEPSQPLRGFAGLFLDPTTSRSQLIISADVAPGLTGTRPEGAYRNGLSLMGNFDPTQSARSTYIDYDIFAAREAVTDATQSGQTALSEVNGVALTRDRSLMASSKALNAESQFPGVNFCQCEFSRWGFWSQETSRTDANGRELSDRTHLGTWVVGELADATQIPTTGTATYAGHIVGAFRNGANEYVAAGQFRNAVDFATQRGTVAVTGLDGTDYRGSVNLAPGSSFFFGSGLTSVAGPTRTMSMDGQFFKGAAGPYHEMGGGFSVRGTGYAGSGIFLGKQ